MRTASSISSALRRASRAETPPWMRAASAICSPIVITGFSEYFGSCSTSEMRAPRIARRVRLDAVSRSIPSKDSRFASSRALGGSRRRMDRPVSDLPDPLSPTMPSRSRPSAKDTPRTARNGPFGVWKVTRRSSTSSSAVTSPASGRARRAARRRAG
jgi:hypothetical protein